MPLAATTRRLLLCTAFGAMTVALLLGNCAAPAPAAAPGPSPVVATQTALPESDFTRPAERPHDPAALVFGFDQLDYYYRVPGEYTHRLNGSDYGFEALSFIVTETHPGGGPGLHVHDVEEAHVLLEGTAEYRIGDQTFTVHGPYIARVPPGVPHTFINAGSSPFRLVAVFASKHPTTKRIGPNPLVSGKHAEEPPFGFIP